MASLIRFGLILAALLLHFSVKAEDRFVVHFVSYHFDSAKDWNEVNPGFGFQRRKGDSFWQVGVFHNSIRRETVYAVYGKEPYRIGSVHFGGVIGLGTGYNSKVVPIPALTARIDLGQLNLHMIATPTVRRDGYYYNHGALGFLASHRF